MNRNAPVSLSLAVSLFGLLLAAPEASAQIQGYGKDATGGSTTCTVTTSAGSGTGSFTSCLSQTNRNIVFAVATTTLSANTYIPSNTTIDGCANGQNGVTIDQSASSNRGLIIEGPTSNIVIRCMRFQGPNSNDENFDLLSLDGTGGTISRIAVDRSSFIGASDGALDITGNVTDVTVQNSLFYGSILTQLIKYDTRMRISLHHNVYTAGSERNPQIKGDATKIDFVSNAIYQNTLASFGYGLRVHNGNSSSDSPGNVQINVVANAFMGTNAYIDLLTDSGASASGVYIAPNNYCSPSSNCVSSPASSPHTTNPGYEVTPTLPGCMATAMMPNVGAPNRTTTDRARIDAVTGALPTNCTGALPSLSIGNASVTEGDSGTTTATFTATLSAAATGNVTVNFATANGTATSGSDYVAQSGPLTFTAGQTTKTIAVVVNGDTAVEPTETFFVNLTAPSGATILDAQGAGTITSDDSLPQISINDVSLTEGNSGTKNATFTVTLSSPLTSAVSVTYATSNGTATAGSDYAASIGSVSFAAGATSQTLNVVVSGDTLVEPNETIVVNLSAPSGATILDSTGIGTITNDDATPTLSISDASVTEGNSGTTSATFTVTLSAASGSSITANYGTANGTATAGSDYVAQSGVLTFTTGQTSKTIAVVVNGDATVEGNETFVINITGASGATILDGQGTGSIVNDDTPPSSGEAVSWTSLVGVSASGGSLTKTASTSWGNAGAISSKVLTAGDGHVEFTVTETTTHRELGLSNGNTNSNWDDLDFGLYLDASGALKVYEKGVLKGTFGTFAAGQLLRVSVGSGVVRYWRNGTVFYSSTASPTYPLLVDSALYNQAATLTNAVLSGAWSAQTATPQLSINDVSVTEGNTGTKTATFTVNLSPASASSVTVSYATANGTATAGTDYVAASSTLTFPGGSTSQTISITLNGDTTVETDETFVVNLSSPSGATILDGQGVGTVLNDDAPPASGEAVVWTSMLGASANGGSLTKTASTGWGNAGAISSKVLPAGDGYVEFRVTETNTHRILGLSNGNTDSNWTDIDFGAYLYASGAIQVYEKGVLKGSFGNFAAGDTIRVSVTTGVVRYSRNGTVFYSSTLAPAYPLLVDTSLYNQGATLTNSVISGAWTTGSANPQISINDVSITEGNAGTKSATFTATLSSAAGATVTVSYATANGTATAGSDYVTAGGTATFAAGSLSQAISVTLNGDTTVEGDETFVVNLSSPAGASILDAQAIGTILNDDAPPSSGVPVAWTSLVGVSANGGTLTKTASTAWGNAGAVSSQVMASGTGHVEFTVTETTTHRILGLSNGNTNTNWDDIDFGLYLYASGPIQVYEKGVLKGAFGTFASGDRLRVSVESGLVKYWKNGIVFYTSVASPTYPLLVDTSLFNVGATLTNTVVSGTWQ